MKNKGMEVKKLKKKYHIKIIMILLWIFVGFLIIRGVGTLIRGNTINLNPFKQEITTKIDKITVEDNATAFAENFINEYMTYTGDDKDYFDRVKKYTNIEFKNTKIEQQEVTYVNKISSRWQNSNLILVDLKVKIATVPDMGSFFDKYMPTNTPTPVPTLKSTTNIPTKATPKASIKPTVKPTVKPTMSVTVKKKTAKPVVNNKKTEIMLLTNETVTDKQNDIELDTADNTETYYIRVPITVDKGSYIVSGYPTFISSMETNIKSRDMLGEKVKDTEKIKLIEELVNSFVEAYYEGDKTELSYFIEDGKDINCLNGEFEIKNIEKTEITKYKNKYYCRIYYQVKSKKGNIFENGMEFKIIEKENKLFIEDFNTSIN